MKKAKLASLRAVSTTSLESARDSGILIFGYGSFARDLARAAENTGIPVLGHVVSGEPPAARHPQPVWSLRELPVAVREKPLWIGVFNQSPNSSYQTINDLCIEASLVPVFPQQFFDLVESFMGWRYWLTRLTNYSAHEADFQSAYDQLSDTRSQRTFVETVAFRIGNTLTAPLAESDTPHYFPDFAVEACRARKLDSLTLLDGGAYDGDTLEVSTRYLPFKTVYAFEPDLDNYRALTRRTRGLGIQAINYPCGLSGNNEKLRFSSGKGDACSVREDGDSMIQVVRLDDCLQNTHIDYLKLDVEGQEIPTLESGRDLILKNRPVLAIAAYHRWDDLWRIPAFVASLKADYRLAYRSHSFNSFEGVFYAY